MKDSRLINVLVAAVVFYVAMYHVVPMLPDGLVWLGQIIVCLVTLVYLLGLIA